MILGSLGSCHLKFLFTTNWTCDRNQRAGIFIVMLKVIIIHSFTAVDAVCLAAEDLGLGKELEHLSWNRDVVTIVLAIGTFLVTVLLSFRYASGAYELLTMLALLWIVYHLLTMSTLKVFWWFISISCTNCRMEEINGTLKSFARLLGDGIHKEIILCFR
jgi:uncharacterized membrane protein